MERPSDLACEHLHDPVALGTRHPRFSWVPPRGLRGSGQTACRIVCSRDRSKAGAGIGEVWDSGIMETGRCSLVPYSGPPLDELTTYWWAVKTWNGGESPWSHAARFGTGVLDPASWKASWITMPETVSETADVLLVEGSIACNRHVPATFHHAIYLRTEFVLERIPVRATAFFSGLGYGELFVNGRRTGDHRLDPGQTDYSKFALCSAWDVAGSLGKGRNALGIVLGNGRYLDAYGFGKPRGFLRIELEYDDGCRGAILSDATWKCSHGPVLHNGIYSGEAYDARLERPGWAETGFAGEGWGDVAIVDGPPLVPQTMPPIRAVRELPALAMTNPFPGVYVFDFGQNFAGVARLAAKGPRGTEITLRFAELLDGAGGLHLGTNRESRSRDTFILAGEGTEVFEPRFTYHGFRYAEVRGYPGTPTPTDMRGIVLHTDVPVTGSFACRDAVAGAIHANVVRGQLANLMSAPTDCPQRGERMGWLGDAQLASEEACCNFDMAAFYAKYLEDIRHAQRPDGSLSDVVPPYWPIYPADPAWASAYPALAWAMYWHYGDAQTLERHYEPVRRYVDFLHASAEGNILRSLGSYGDWCPPGSVFPKRTPVEFTSTWYLCHDTFLFARIAAALGRTADAALYETRAREVARAFNERYLGDDGRYAIATTSPIDRSVAQTNQALPLALGIVPAELRERVAGHLVTAVVKNADCHIDAGIVGARYIPEVLADLGYADLAWRMITTTTYPGWGYMVAEGATTLWERWEKLAGQGMNSHNHIMFGSVDAWFYRCLAGIVPLEPGWTRVRIAPHAPASLGHASASRMTPRGRISVSWSEGTGPAGGANEAGASGRSGPGPFRLAVSIPDGVSACVALPPGDAGRELREGGRPVWGAQAADTKEAAEGRGGAYPGGIRAVRAAGNLVEVEIGSGDYEFELLR